MGWSENPFTNMAIHFLPDERVHWHCDNCGGEGDLFSSDGPAAIIYLREDWLKHVRDSHKMQPSDVRDWSVSCGTEARKQKEQAPLWKWVSARMKDARVGDIIRPAGTDAPGSKVTGRRLPPRRDGSDAGYWHVIEGVRNHWDDRIVREGECWLVLDGGQPQNFNPDFGIEIKMDPVERDAIEMLGGFENRLDA